MTNPNFQAPITDHKAPLAFMCQCPDSAAGFCALFMGQQFANWVHSILVLPDDTSLLLQLAQSS